MTWIWNPVFDVHMINAWVSDYEADREIMLEKQSQISEILR